MFNNQSSFHGRDIYLDRLNQKREEFIGMGVSHERIEYVRSHTPQLVGLKGPSSNDTKQSILSDWEKYYDLHEVELKAGDLLDQICSMEKCLAEYNFFVVEAELVGLVGDYSLLIPAGFTGKDGLFATDAPVTVQVDCVKDFPNGVTKYWTRKQLQG